MDADIKQNETPLKDILKSSKKNQKQEKIESKVSKTNPIHSDQLNLPLPKKRGRPPKSQQEVVKKAQTSRPQVLSPLPQKRRGRPTYQQAVTNRSNSSNGDSQIVQEMFGDLNKDDSAEQYYSSDDVSESDPSKKYGLAQSEVKRFKELQIELEKHPVLKLKEMLKLNNLVVKGTKDDLVDKIALEMVKTENTQAKWKSL